VKLQDFFATLGPFLQGHASQEATVRALYGAPQGRAEVDARRLAIYERFARHHRFEVVDGMYPHLRRAVVARGGEAAWERLAAAYFQRHPMRHFELNANAAHLPEFLQGYAPQEGLPAWMPELADLEWWEWQALVAPSDAGEDGAGPRISASVELRPYAHDLVEWLETPADARPEAPEARACIVVFWRTPEFRLRRENTTPQELLVLKAVAEGLTLGDVAAQAGASREELEETFQDLARAGILVGVTLPEEP
jgi:hypothetical protein